MITREQLLAGKGPNDLEEKNVDVIFQKVENLKPIAQKLGCTLAQLAIAWVLQLAMLSYLKLVPKESQRYHGDHWCHQDGTGTVSLGVIYANSLAVRKLPSIGSGPQTDPGSDGRDRAGHPEQAQASQELQACSLTMSIVSVQEQQGS